MLRLGSAAPLLCLMPLTAAAKDLKDRDAGYVYGPEPSWDRFKELAEAAVLAQLIDPDSAKFEWPWGYLKRGYTAMFQKRVHGYVSCGFVNSRNRMGGYVGRQAFAIVEDYDMVLVADIEDKPNYDFIATGCARAGLPPAPSALARGGNGFAFALTQVPDGAYVASVLPGSAADKAGLRPGMVIGQLNGVSLKGMSLGIVNQMLGGATGPVTLAMVGGAAIRVGKEAMATPPPPAADPFDERLKP